MSEKLSAKACPPDHKHGENNTCYCEHKCRCRVCKDARAEAARQRLKLKAYGRWHDRPNALLPATGMRRRLQALVVLGWSQAALGRELGVSPARARTLMTLKFCTRNTHDKVVALFDRLWDTPAPRVTTRDKHVYSRTVHYAQARRWLPPLAWDDIDTDPEPPYTAKELDSIDEVAVDLACSGEHVRLTTPERRVAVATLHARQHSDTTIAELLSVDPRTVLRIRKTLGLPAIALTEIVKIAA